MSANAASPPEASRRLCFPLLPFGGQMCGKTQSQSRLYDKQAISDGSFSIVAKRRRHPRLATTMCFPIEPSAQKLPGSSPHPAR